MTNALYQLLVLLKKMFFRFFHCTLFYNISLDEVNLYIERIGCECSNNNDFAAYICKEQDGFICV